MTFSMLLSRACWLSGWQFSQSFCAFINGIYTSPNIESKISMALPFISPLKMYFSILEASTSQSTLCRSKYKIVTSSKFISRKSARVSVMCNSLTVVTATSVFWQYTNILHAPPGCKNWFIRSSVSGSQRKSSSRVGLSNPPMWKVSWIFPAIHQCRSSMVAGKCNTNLSAYAMFICLTSDLLTPRNSKTLWFYFVNMVSGGHLVYSWLATDRSLATAPKIICSGFDKGKIIRNDIQT